MPRKYSPSQHHKPLIKAMQPSLAYDGSTLKPWQRKIRNTVKTLLGDWPTERPHLNVKSLWTQDHKFGSIEKITFTSEANSDVLAYVCLPKNAKPPYQFFVCLQGHSTGMHNSIGVDRDDEFKKITVEGDRDFAIGCMKRGMAALCIEQRSFGLRREQTQQQTGGNGCHDATMQALLLGRTLIGERVFDVDRGIDYLASRGDVDMKKIGVMGNSGGGTIALFSAAVLSRVAYAMPSCYFNTFKDSIGSIHHCADNYLPGILKYVEMADVMGAFAPKPVTIVAGKTDDIFPIGATRREFKRLQAIYEAAGARENCKLVVGNGGHRFYADAAWKAMKRLMT